MRVFCGMAETESETGEVQIEYDTLTHNQGGGEICLSLRIYKPPASASSTLESKKKNDGWVAVLVHQYSVLGGCQALLKGTATVLAMMGMYCVTFDMRGVKRSSGKTSLTGSSEVEDAVAVCEWAHQAYPEHRLLLVGSSAGNASSLFVNHDDVWSFVLVFFLVSVTCIM